VRHLWHILASVGMWCLFGYYWRVVLDREIGPDTVRAMLLLGGLNVVGLVITMTWIAHNLRLARRFADRRRAVRDPGPPAYERDTIDRPITRPDLAELRRARVIDIDADAGTKTVTIAAAGEAP
jgi:hypothetical protein